MSNHVNHSRVQVITRDPGETEYLQQKFPGLSHAAALAAIKTAGPVRREIIRYIAEHVLKERIP